MIRPARPTLAEVPLADLSFQLQKLQVNAMLRRIPVCAGLLLWAVSPAFADYALPDLEKVPVDRLVANLTKLTEDEPEKAGHQLNLARAHAMAYSLKAIELEVAEGSNGVPWFGEEPGFVPFSEVKSTDDQERIEYAKEHLSQALLAYQRAAKLAPDDMTVRIGLAWVTAESGQKAEAIRLYRKLINDAWNKNEKDLKQLGLGGHTITAEAGGYLVALLDEKNDKAEIEDLRGKISKLQKLPRPITPIVIPLSNGLSVAELEDSSARVLFDGDGSGLKRPWTWITDKAAWLVHDPTQTGKVDSALSLFGSVTFWMFWTDGYQALAALDDDRSGELTGSELAGLALWHDRNGDGVSDSGEVRPLSEYGIESLSCRSEVLEDHPDRIAHSPRGVTFRDGQTRPTFDLILKAEKSLESKGGSADF